MYGGIIDIRKNLIITIKRQLVLAITTLSIKSSRELSLIPHTT